MFDIIIIAIIAVLGFFAAKSIIKRKGKCASCANCEGCPSGKSKCNCEKGKSDK